MSSAAPPPSAPSEACDLSVVVPVYDEAQVLEANLEAIVAFLEPLGESFELVAVDDGSRDDSLAILERFAQRDPRLKVERNPRNLGKGAAVKRGMLAARGRRVLFMDADLSTPLEEIPAFLGALDTGMDVVIGNRRAPGSQVTRHQPWIRETLGRGFTALTRMLLAPGVHDFTCGFKAFRHDAARAVFERTTRSAWAFDAEVVVIAHSLGLKLAQVPVRWADEEGTKVRLLRAIPGTLFELLVIASNRIRGRYR